MKNHTAKNKITWAANAITVLYLCYLMSRYLFFSPHGMKEWPLDLFIAGSVIIIVAAFTYSRIVISGTVIGYLIGFASGMLFNQEGTDPGGGRTNNAWIIWTVSFVCIIFVSLIAELVSRRAKRRPADR